MQAWLTTISNPHIVMRIPGIILLMSLSSISNAAEKLPLADFLQELLQDIRHQLHSIEQQSGDQSAPAIIKNVHVEMQVIAEKDQAGNIAYYVLAGKVDEQAVVTQKLSFDLELQHNAAVKSSDTGYRTYSTRNRDYTYRPDGYRPSTQYPYHPDQYMPNIHPVILYDKQR